MNGEQPREVFDLKYVNHVAISPDGRSVAFTELFNGYVAPLPLTGGSIELNKDTKAIPVTRLGTDMGSYLHWSADSKSVHWMVGDRYHGRALTAAKPDAGVAVGLRLPTDQPTDAHALVGGRVVTMRNAQGTQEVIEDGVVLVRSWRSAPAARWRSRPARASWTSPARPSCPASWTCMRTPHAH